MNLYTALCALAPALQTTPRYVTVTACLSDKLIAYNGEVLGCAPLDASLNDWADNIIMLNADRLSKVWQENSKLYSNDKTVRIQNGRVGYSLPRLFEEPMQPPLLDNFDCQLTAQQVQAILLAVKFASTNAIYPWANGVSVTKQGLIATNNQTLVNVECDLWLGEELTLPFWAIKLLDTDKKPPRMAVSDNMIAFRWQDGVVLQAQRLAADMPSTVYALAGQLGPATDAIDLAAMLDDMDKLESHLCSLGPQGIVVSTRTGEEAAVETPFNGNFKLTIETARLVLQNATHLAFDHTPRMLRFSKDTEPRLIGFASGMQ